MDVNANLWYPKPQNIYIVIMDSAALQRVSRAIEALKQHRPIIVLDDLDRENEGDLILPAECVTAPLMALFIRYCSGIVCLCLTDEKLKALELPPMVQTNESRYGTAFTVSIEAREGVSTGVSAADRVTTIRAAIAPNAKPTDIVSPGHMFPLRANPGGVLARRGHTEGAIDFAVLAGFAPAAILCELMNDDGTMMRGDALAQFAQAHDFPLVSIDDLVQYRLKSS